MLLYHGTTLNSEYLKPQLDPRTGTFGIWLTDIKEHAMIYSILKLSSEATVNWSSHDNKFRNASIKTNQDNLETLGYIYTFEIPETEVKKIKKHSYISLSAKLTPTKKDIVTIEDLKFHNIEIMLTK